MNKSYLLLGSNIGKRESFLLQAIELINKKTGNVILQSSVYNTKAWGNQDQDDFLNQAICVETKFSAEKLMKEILLIEKMLGRERPFYSTMNDKKWQPRMIDIDILFFNSEIIQSPNLTIPHPFLHKRRFALVPLAEIAEDFIHPILKKPVKQLLYNCSDNLVVRSLSKA